MIRQPSHYLFVPPVLSTLNITPEDCQLVASYNKSANRTKFTYAVSWTNEKACGNTLKDEEDDALLLSIRAPVDETSQFLSDIHQAKRSAVREKLVLCDGPCGRKYAPESMTVLGRCGHFLCNVCSGLVYNDDGTKGCSNFGCVFATLYDYLPEDYARKAYENHIIARQRARESALHHSPNSHLPQRYKPDFGMPIKSPVCGTPCRRKQGMRCLQPCPRLTRGATERDLCKQGRSLTPRSIRARRSTSSCNLRRATRTPSENCRTAIEGDSSCLLKSSYGRSPSSDPSNRKRRVLDEIFSDMTLTSNNLEGPTSEFELLSIRLMIFERGPFKTIKRVHISREMSAALTVKQAIDELMDRRNGNIRHECPSSLYFCSGNTGDGLRKITVEEFETAHLWQYPARNSVLHFVLDTVGYLKGPE